MATTAPLQLGMVGLGRMGANLARRAMRDGHALVVHDLDAAAVRALEAEGATGASTLDALVRELELPRAVWVMVPAGAATEQAVRDLAALLEPGDVIVDGGNTHYRDDIRRSRELDAFAGRVSDSGEGRWTALAAIEEGLPAPVLTAALHARFASQGAGLYAGKLLSAMREQFGGHAEKPPG